MISKKSWNEHNESKTLFNLDVTKQAQEASFSRNALETDHPFVYFDNTTDVHTDCTMHLRM